MEEPQPVVEPTREVTVEVAAPPEVVWGLVSDPTRTPEWSPVVRRSGWLAAGGSPVVGARFVGHNRFNGFRWTRECVVTEAEPGRVFGFSTLGRGGEEQTRWRYRMEPSRSGTRLSLAYEVVSTPRWVRIARAMPGGRSTNDRQARQNVEESLRRLDAILELEGSQ